MAKKRLSAKKKGMAVSIAEERVAILLKLARETYLGGDAELARRYCRLARKVQLRYRVRLKKETALKYCKKCFTPWIVGRTVRVRTNSKNKCVEYTCVCGRVKRYVYR